MKKILLVAAAIIATMVTCKEFDNTDLDQSVIITAETPLKNPVTAVYVGETYDIEITATSARNLGSYDIIATSTFNLSAELNAGGKKYASGDTLHFKTGVTKKIQVKILAEGTYTLTFDFATQQGEKIGVEKLTFTANAAGLNADITSALYGFTGESGSHGFVGGIYTLNILATSDLTRDISLKYEVDKAAEITAGPKNYSPADTIKIDLGVEKRLSFRATEAGNYRLILKFTDDFLNKEVLRREISFVVVTPDLGLMILKNNTEITNLYERPAYIETSDNFTVRAFSMNEDLASAALRVEQTGNSIELTGNIRPGSVRPGSIRLASAEDLATAPTHIKAMAATAAGGLSVADFNVQYDAVALGTTKLKFTANSSYAEEVLQDSVKVTAGTWGVQINNAPYDANLKQFVRPDTWAGLTDSINYLIDVNFNNVGSKVFKVKFESLYPEKTALTWAKNLPFEVGNIWDYGEWYDFSDILAGKIFYFAKPGAGVYSDVIKMTVKNGEMGSEIEQHVKITFKNTDDFDFAVTFKHKSLPTDDPAVNDTIYYSELENIPTLVRLEVKDDNPYSKFDYKITQDNATLAIYRNIRHTCGTNYTITYGQYEGGGTQYIQNYIDLGLAVTNQEYDKYFGEFDFKYTVKRVVDGKEKEITKHIVILDDRLDFDLGMAPGNARQDVYINEPLNTFQFVYKQPSTNADDYELTVTTADENIVDLYVVNKSASFSKMPYNTVIVPPATNADNGAALASATAGLIRFKGHTPGNATLSFKLRHKVTGAEKTITREITCQDDPVSYTITPVVSKDATSSDVPASPLGSTIHKRLNPRFKLRISSATNYAGNNNGTVKIRFVKNGEYTNEANVYQNGTTGMPVNSYYTLNTDTDYTYELRPAADSRVWTMPAGYAQQVKIEILKDFVEYPLKAEQEVKYVLRNYQPAEVSYSIAAQPLQTNWNQDFINEELDMNAGVLCSNDVASKTVNYTITAAIMDGYDASSITSSKTRTINNVSTQIKSKTCITYYRFEQDTPRESLASNYKNQGSDLVIPGITTNVNITYTDNWGYVYTPAFREGYRNEWRDQSDNDWQWHKFGGFWHEWSWGDDLAEFYALDFSGIKFD